jgi:hypothetical protein
MNLFLVNLIKFTFILILYALFYKFFGNGM